MDEIIGRMRFPLTPHAPRNARRWADRVIDLHPEVRTTLMLLLSELVSNSVRHSGCGPFAEIDVRIRQVDGSAHVEVRDPGPPRRIRASDALEHSGLRIVDRLSDRWGVRHDPTTVWFDVG